MCWFFGISGAGVGVGLLWQGYWEREARRRACAHAGATHSIWTQGFGCDYETIFCDECGAQWAGEKKTWEQSRREAAERDEV